MAPYMDRECQFARTLWHNSRVPEVPAISTLKAAIEGDSENRRKTDLFTEQPRRLHLEHFVQEYPQARVKGYFSLFSTTAVQCAEEFLDIIFCPDDWFQAPAFQLQLIGKMRRNRCYKILQRIVLLSWGAIRYADREQMSNEVWIPEGKSVCKCSAPVKYGQS